MKKAVIYVGIIVLSVITFYGFAVGLSTIANMLYLNTSLIDWIYESNWCEPVILGTAVVMACEEYYRLKRCCNL